MLIAVAHPVVAEDVAVVPKLLSDLRRLSAHYACPLDQFQISRPSFANSFERTLIAFSFHGPGCTFICRASAVMGE